MQYVYACIMCNFSKEEIISQSINNYEFDANQLKAIEYLANNKDEIQKVYSDNLAKNWSWSRLAFVEQAILLSAYCEFKTSGLDKGVIISQALITTNRFCGDEEKKFINALLDKVLI